MSYLRSRNDKERSRERGRQNTYALAGELLSLPDLYYTENWGRLFAFSSIAAELGITSRIVSFVDENFQIVQKYRPSIHLKLESTSFICNGMILLSSESILISVAVETESKIYFLARGRENKYLNIMIFNRIYSLYSLSLY